MCTVYCLHAKKRPWFLVDMSHFLDRKPKIIFPTFLLFDSVMERLFINLKSKLGSIDRRRSLLRCIINHCQRKPCVGNAIATKLPLQISSHRVFQLFGPARLSWLPRFVPASECTASTKVAAVQENMIMNHIHLNSINSFHLQKNHQFPIWTFFWFFPPFSKKKQQNNFTLQSPPSLTVTESAEGIGFGWIQVYHLGFLGSTLLSMLRRNGFRMTGGTEKRLEKKNGCPSPKKGLLNIPPIFLQCFFFR